MIKVLFYNQLVVTRHSTVYCSVIHRNHGSQIPWKYSMDFQSRYFKCAIFEYLSFQKCTCPKLFSIIISNADSVSNNEVKPRIQMENLLQYQKFILLYLFFIGSLQKCGISSCGHITASVWSRHVQACGTQLSVVYSATLLHITDWC